MESVEIEEDGGGAPPTPATLEDDVWNRKFPATAWKAVGWLWIALGCIAAAIVTLYLPHTWIQRPKLVDQVIASALLSLSSTAQRERCKNWRRLIG
mmetsp:Transcript_44436/g.110634  ORF Transcript_44436/g.110634 Transcript_44436/m.110634 type:complete len:96 (-) Transcript_44436:1390-1677(-)